jgi:hypothetical protein
LANASSAMATDDSPGGLVDHPDLAEVADAARRALRDDAGVGQARAAAVVRAVAVTAAKEALAVAAGRQEVYGSALDTRLARLRGLLDALEATEAPLSPYEIGVILRITPSQASSLVRTYRARYSDDYRRRMNQLVRDAVAAKTTAKASKSGVPGAKGTPATYTLPFANTAALEYAADRLRRHGLARSLKEDKVALTLTIDQDVRDPDGRDAVAFLTADSA